MIASGAGCFGQDSSTVVIEFGECGLPLDRIVVRPNFLSRDPGAESHERCYALFIGRLSSEKGIQTLLKAWDRIGDRLPLKIAGDGPLAEEVRATVRLNSSIEWLGFQPSPRILELLRRAQVTVFPSVWYECLPRTIVESYAVGTPVLASDLGAMTELVDHGRTGRRFNAGDATALAQEVDWCLRHPSELAAMGREARAEFESKYAVGPNYRRLIEIYEQTIDHYSRQAPRHEG
jgi:glycosyltransferase involved in cell wall biosynthesis